MLSKLRIRPVDLRVPDVRLQNTRLQIVDQQAIGHPSVELDHRDVALHERLLFLRICELDERQTTAGELCGKGIHTTLIAAGAIEQCTDGAVVYLGLLSRR